MKIGMSNNRKNIFYKHKNEELKRPTTPIFDVASSKHWIVMECTNPEFMWMWKCYKLWLWSIGLCSWLCNDLKFIYFQREFEIKIFKGIHKQKTQNLILMFWRKIRNSIYMRILLRNLLVAVNVCRTRNWRLIYFYKKENIYKHFMMSYQVNGS